MIKTIVVQTSSVVLLSSIIAACSTYKNLEPWANTAPAAPAFVLPTNASTLAPSDNWWNQLQDQQLTNLLILAKTKNHTLRIAQASVMESRALLLDKRLDQLPSIAADVTATRQKVSADDAPSSTNRISNRYDAGLNASWELDLFGRVSNSVKLSRAEYQQKIAELQAAQVSVAAELASAYIQLRGDQYLLQIAEQNLRKQEETLALTQRLAQVGRGDSLDVDRAASQRKLTQSNIPALQASISVGLNRIEVLTGSPSAELKTQLASPQPLPNIPASFAVGDPITLLQRRPDIQRAEQALAGAIAQYNIQVADLYPSISFTGGLGYASSNWHRLGDEGTDIFHFTPRIHWAAFNLGQVRARIQAADSHTQALVAELEQRIQIALEETDNALKNYTKEEERRAHLQEAATASYRAATASRKKYEIGVGDFSTVLDAERAQLNVGALLAQSDTQLLLDLVGIYRALGGGWQIEGEKSVALE